MVKALNSVCRKLSTSVSSSEPHEVIYLVRLPDLYLVGVSGCILGEVEECHIEALQELCVEETHTMSLGLFLEGLDAHLKGPPSLIQAGLVVLECIFVVLITLHKYIYHLSIFFFYAT